MHQYVADAKVPQQQLKSLHGAPADVVADPMPRLAIFTFAPNHSVHAEVDICLVSHATHESYMQNSFLEVPCSEG